MIKKILQQIALVIMFSPVIILADEVLLRNGFFVETQILPFSQNTVRVQCDGEVPYPVFSNSDEELFMTINREVENFAERYAICNKGNRSHYSVEFEIPESGDINIFSIKWITKRYDRLVRIDTLNFDAQTGVILEPEDIFHMHSNNLMHEIAKLSERRLHMQTTWDQFLNKIKNRDIQLYIENGQWFLAFNEAVMFGEMLVAKLPRYFIQYRNRNDR